MVSSVLNDWFEIRGTDSDNNPTEVKYQSIRIEDATSGKGATSSNIYNQAQLPSIQSPLDNHDLDENPHR